jgi:Fic family protein
VSKVIRRRWYSSSEMTRRDRQGCDYEAYIPDPLEGRSFRLDGDVAADVADAEADIVRLNVEGAVLPESDALARVLMRAESVASSYIEGLMVGARRLLRAEAAHVQGDASGDGTAEAVLANIDAMRWAVDSMATAGITVDGLREVHRRLMAGAPELVQPGEIRTVQNWIGGSGFNPCSAEFVPPPPEHVPALLADLCAFCEGDDLPAVAQAAIAHAQFETIHPFADGNGRTGRALIHVILRRRDLAPRLLPPVSLVLASWSKTYIGALTATRYRGRVDSSLAHAGMNGWIATFAGACRRAVGHATSFEEHVAQVQEDWRDALGGVRADSAVDKLLAVLPGAPVTTVPVAASLIGRSRQATNEAFARLVEAKVVRQVTIGRRNRAFEVPAIIRALTDLERQMASPAGDTRIAPPGRPVVPRRPRG